ncbi:MAG: RsmD family RNA methyltransferase [Prolixibacteraceae bacterium]
MRIVGGTYKGRHFSPGKKFNARPTTDMAKENLFNILQNRVDFEHIKVLDLFSGTGSISFEFASRGCRDITSVELDFHHFSFIRQIIEKLGEKNIKAIKANAFRFIEQTNQSFDLVFADPPFNHPQFKEVPGKVLTGNILLPGGIFILEHSKIYDFSSLPEWEEIRNYGSVHFSFFRKPIIY